MGCLILWPLTMRADDFVGDINSAIGKQIKTPLLLDIKGTYKLGYRCAVDNAWYNSTTDGAFSLLKNGFVPNRFLIAYEPLIMPSMRPEAPFSAYNQTFSSDGKNDMWYFEDKSVPSQKRAEVFNGESVLVRAGMTALGYNTSLASVKLLGGLTWHELVERKTTTMEVEENNDTELRIQISDKDIGTRSIVTIDKSHGWNLSRAETFGCNLSTKKPSGIRDVIEVKKFVLIGSSALWYPVDVLATVQQDDQIEYSQEILVSSVSLADTSSKFSIPLPAGTTLVDDRIGAIMTVGDTPDSTFKSLRPVVEEVRKNQEDK